MAHFATLFLVLVVAWYLLAPFFDLPAETDEAIEYADAIELRDSRERYVQMLKDLELDHAMGRVGEDDYKQMKNSISADLARLIQRGGEDQQAS